ncbi:hypothetical protein [Maricaulis sp.]|uniref:hypothetical protein n=1 Tax=Maricaulis sp. TaxID=1486257 RepID=UPI003A90B5FA
MILSRVVHHLKAQNWTAVGLEFLIVIAGVVIGFQVTAWNAARQDRFDEAQFVENLHDDLVLAEALSARVRDRRLDRVTDINNAIETLYGRTDHEDLSTAECDAISASQYFHLNVPDLTAFTELADAGRIDIIRDQALRRALVRYQQSRAALRDNIFLQSSIAHDLPFQFPELINVDAYFDPGVGEIRGRISCDTEAMRASRLFLNAVSQNADSYDAYGRDGLRPWSDQLNQVHARADVLLNLSHEQSDTEQ